MTGAILLMLAAGCRQQPGDDRLFFSGQTMGTTWSVVLRSATAVDVAKLKQQLQDQLDHINALMSTYDPASEISRFNRQTTDDWFELSNETFHVIELSQKISGLTGGAFDISIGALVDLWGFGATETDRTTPAAKLLGDVQSQVGYEHLHLHADRSAISKKIPGLRIDLSAIAKGYAVDVLAGQLDRLQIEDYLVEIGGEMKIAGSRSNDIPWRIAVEKPLAGSRGVESVLSVTDIALATSGNYRNFYEVDGQRYGHTMDPGSGRPVQHNLASVTVFDPSCARADALATAVMVMGAEQGKRFCQKHNIAAYFLIHEEDGLVSYASSAFQGLVQRMNP